MLKRKAWIKPPRQPLQLPTEKTEPRAKMTRADDCVASVPKGEYIRSLAYRKAVAGLGCFRCGVIGFSNAAHSDSDNKGGHIKSSDTTCYPLCVDRPGIRGCHSLVGASGTLKREERRELEQKGAEDTQCQLILKSHGLGREAQRLRGTLRKVGLVL